MSQIFVRFQFAGFHHWPSAPVPRAYLGASHRHIFHFQIKMAVAHDDREVEFHDLIDVGSAIVGEIATNGDFGGMSCEHIATRLAEALVVFYGRSVEVTVSEDNECGAIVAAPRWTAQSPSPEGNGLELGRAIG